MPLPHVHMQGTCSAFASSKQPSCQVALGSCSPGKALALPNAQSPKQSADTCQPLTTLAGCRCKGAWAPNSTATLTGRPDWTIIT